jgi:hypothetical protein
MNDTPLSEHHRPTPQSEHYQPEQGEIEFHEAGHAVEGWLQGRRLRRVSCVEDGTTDGRCEWYPLDIRHLSVLDVTMGDARVVVAGGVACAIKVGRPDTQGMRTWVGGELPEKMPDAWLDPLLISVRDDLQANWPRVEALVAELLSKWWLWDRAATAVIEGAGLTRAS